MRTAQRTRTTAETSITVAVALDNWHVPEIATGLGFFDHMLVAFATHARIGLRVQSKGDLHVDDHHTVEDTAITLGQAADEALGERKGIERFGEALAPMDESLARVALDLSGRPASVIDLGLQRDTLGDVACENIAHFFSSFATASRSAIHVDVLRGKNDHHRAEAAFKGLAVAFRRAIATSNNEMLPSSKGVL